MRGFARTAALLVLALLVSPAGLLACAWQCDMPAPAAQASAPEAAGDSCHGRGAEPSSGPALSAVAHDCASHVTDSWLARMPTAPRGAVDALPALSETPVAIAMPAPAALQAAPPRGPAPPGETGGFLTPLRI